MGRVIFMRLEKKKSILRVYGLQTDQGIVLRLVFVSPRRWVSKKQTVWS